MTNTNSTAFLFHTCPIQLLLVPITSSQLEANLALRASALAFSAGSPKKPLLFFSPPSRAGGPLRPPRPLLRPPPLRSWLCRLPGRLPSPSPRSRPRFKGRSGRAESRPVSSFSSSPKRFARSVRFLDSSSSSMPNLLARSARFLASSSATEDDRPRAKDCAGSAGFSSAAGSSSEAGAAISSVVVAAAGAASAAGASAAGLAGAGAGAAASSSL